MFFIALWHNSKLFVAAGCAALACVAFGCGSKPPVEDPKTSPAGMLFQKNCATCHGPNGDGGMVANKPVPSLKLGKALTDPDERLTQQITHGGNGMPPFKYTLSDDEIRQLLVYVRGELQGQKKKI